jgi:Family of unknown function (DUF6056)
MSAKQERGVFVGAVLALWLLFFVQALWSPVLLDDWFQLRYWRDHEFGLSALWSYGHHNYFHYNPRLGDVFLAAIDGSQILHLIVTPLIQVALVPLVYVIAFARWPRPTLRDLQLLLVIQILIWMVIPIPGILYFYRPFATNYLWGFTITLALFVPYRLAIGNDTKRRLWLVPIMLVLGWIAGMCNEHTGPTAMVAIAAFVVVAFQRRRLRTWMIAGMVGLYIGYPMLFFAPGQSVRYSGLATRDTPGKLIAERGITGCLEILTDFVRESWLGIVLLLAALVVYRLHHRSQPVLARGAKLAAALLVAASLLIVMTLFASPATTDRVLFASGVLLVAAFAIGMERLFVAREVRRFVVGTCIVLAAYHCARFVVTGAARKAENDHRIALLRAAKPGTIAVVPSYELERRTRWYLGDDFKAHPWLRDYVGGQLFDLAGVEMDRPQRRTVARHVARHSYARTTAAPSFDAPTYRELQAGKQRVEAHVQTQIARGLVRFAVEVVGLPFVDRRGRSVAAYEWTPQGATFIDGRPYNTPRGHFIRVDRATIPDDIEATFVTGCEATTRVTLTDDADALLVPVDERECRGPFTVIMCQPERCWIAGWY